MHRCMKDCNSKPHDKKEHNRLKHMSKNRVILAWSPNYNIVLYRTVVLYKLQLAFYSS